MAHRKDLHLARRLQEVIGSESMEDVFAAALTVCTSSACRNFGVSPMRYPKPVQRFKEAFIGAVTLLLMDIMDEDEAAKAPN